MSDIADSAQETIERAEKSKKSKLNSAVAVLVAISATFVALCNVKDGNVVQAMAQAQAGAVDQWAYYQSKSTKQHIAETTADQLTVQRDIAMNPSPEALFGMLFGLAGFCGWNLHPDWLAKLLG